MRTVRQEGDVLRLAEVPIVVGRLVEFAEGLHELLAVVAELVDDMADFIDDPHMSLWIVGVDPDLVWPARILRTALEQLIPLRPDVLLDLLARAVQHDDGVPQFRARRGGEALAE